MVTPTSGDDVTAADDVTATKDVTTIDDDVITADGEGTNDTMVSTGEVVAEFTAVELATVV